MSIRCPMAWCWAFAFLCLVLPASGQEEWGRSRTDPEWARAAVLLSLEPIRKELGLSSEQQDALARWLRDVEPRSLSSPDMLRAMEEAHVLTEGQLHRLKQIRLQSLGALALLDEDVARRLELTGAQRERLAEVRIADESRLEEKLSKIRFESSVDEKKYIIIFWRTDSNLLEVLTRSQAKRLNEMRGEPYSGISELLARSS